MVETDPVDDGRNDEALSEDGFDSVLLSFREAWEANPELDVTEFCRSYWEGEGGIQSTGPSHARAEQLHRVVEDYLFVLRGLSALGGSAAVTKVHQGQVSEAWDMPEVIGHYRILRRLGEGGMGTVYLAEQAAPVRRKVALKLIKPGMDSRQVLKRFEAERQALALMGHSNIARVFDAGTDEKGHPYFVMEYVDGQPLDMYCKGKGLSLEERIRLFNQICAGVQHAHQKGILHRDLKPSNVIVTEQDGKALPKIIDFGLARAMDDDAAEGSLMTLEGQVLGTPEFMAPEQACREGEDIDSRADIYSLGVMLYLLLTGTLPVPTGVLRQSGLLEMRRKICKEECEAPSTRLSQASRMETCDPESSLCLAWQGKLRGDLDWITMKALEKDRERRYESAAALAEDLWRYLDHEPVLAGPPSGIYRFKKLVRKHRVLFGSLGAIILSLSAAVVFMLIAYAEVHEKEEQARNSLVVMRETEQTLRKLTGMGDEGKKHGDQMVDGWDETFESRGEAWQAGEGEQRWTLPVFDPNATRSLGEEATWFRAADSMKIFLDRRVPEKEGDCWLRLEGAAKTTDGAVVSRWVDPKYHNYVGDFTLTLMFRVGQGEIAGLSCSLRPRATWAPHKRPERIVTVGSRSLFAVRPIPNPGSRRGLGLYLLGGKGDDGLVSTIRLDEAYKLKIRYQLLAGNKIRISGWLNDTALRQTTGGGLKADRYEQDLRWIHFGTNRSPVWFDNIELKRTVPHSPWFKNPGNNRYYALTPRPMGFREAREYAHARKGELAAVRSDDEKLWLRRTFGRHSYFLGVQRSTAKDDLPGDWRWIDERGGQVLPEFWLRGRVPGTTGAPYAALGGSAEPKLSAPEGDGGLVPVVEEARLFALMQFEEEPNRRSYGRLAGDLQWAKSAGGQALGTKAVDKMLRSRGEILSMASVVADRDASNPGGYLVCGSFQYEAVLGAERGSKREDVDAQRCRVQSAGDLDAFVAKYDKDGCILWAKVFGGVGEDQGRGVAVDAKGRVYITGAFAHKAVLGRPGEGRSRSQKWGLNSAGGSDLFVACLDRAGACQWLQRIGGEGEDVATGIACSEEGRVFVSGWVNGQLAAERGHFCERDILLICLRSAGERQGQVLWERKAGGKRDDVAQAVAVMTDGSVVITGAFQGLASFGMDASGSEIAYRSDSIRPDEQKNNLFVARYGTDGALLWVRHPGGKGGRTMGYALAAGPDGACYVAGAVDWYIYLGGPQRSRAELDSDYKEASARLHADPGPGPERDRMEALMKCSSNGWVDAFLAKFDEKGRVAWFTNPKGEDHCNIAYGLAVGPDGSVLMTGRLQGACTFAELKPRQCLRSSYSPGQPDMFVARFRPEDGGLSWVRTARGPGANWGSGVVALGNDRALVVGGFHGPLNFGEGEPNARTLVGGAVFMAAFDMHDTPPPGR